MTKDRDWVDYANVASNVARNFQLESINSKMGQLAELGRQKEDREQEKALQEQCEAIMREAVFQAESALQNFQTIAKENPRAASAWAHHNVHQFQRNGVTSASFRSFEDKGRLRTVLDSHEQLLQECATALSPEQREQSKCCGQYLVERDDLNLLTRLAPHQERLDQAMAELAPFCAKDGKYVLLQVTGSLSLLVGMCLLFQGLVIPGWFVIGMALLLCISSFVVSPKHQRKAELEKKIAILVSNEPLIDPTSSLLKNLRRTFGSAHHSELLKMRTEREALIADVLGKAKPSDGSVTAETTATIPIS